MRKILLTFACLFTLIGGGNANVLKATASMEDASTTAYRPLIYAVSQLNVNSWNSGKTPYNHASYSLSNLVDGTTGGWNFFCSVENSTWFAKTDITEDDWVNYLKSYRYCSDPGYHNLQVTLDKAVSKFKFEYYGRGTGYGYNDIPVEMDIYATNDETLGASTKSAESEQWEFITTWSDDDITNVENAYYESDEIDLGAEYKYVRFVIKNTATKKEGKRTYGSPDITGVEWNLTEFQMYEPYDTSDAKESLRAVVYSAAVTLSRDYSDKYGTDPGYVDSTKIEEAKAYYETCVAALEETHTSDEYTAYAEQLQSLVNAIVISVETGYYNIVSGYEPFYTTQGLYKAMCVNSDKNLYWETLNTADAAQLWYITKLDNGNYSIKNVASGQYINTVEGTYVLQMLMSDEHTTDQIIEADSSLLGIFRLSNTANSTYYYVHDQGSGAYNSGRTGLYNQALKGSYNGSAWYIRKFTGDVALLEKQGMSYSELQTATATAEQTSSDDRKLVFDASQLSSNAYKYNMKNLLDGVNTGITSEIETVWNKIMNEDTLTTAGWAAYIATSKATSAGWHNLQVALLEPISAMSFYMSGRAMNYGYRDTPNNVIIYGTNDESLGTSTLDSETSQWEQITELTQKDMIILMSQQDYTSPEIDFGGKSYKYLRFVVKHTVISENTKLRPYAHTEITGVTYQLNEFQIFGTDYNDLSLYNTVPAMKAAADALNEAIATAKEKLATGDVTSADISAVEEAMAAVEALYAANDTLRADGVSTDDMSSASELTISAATLTSTTTSALQTLVNTNSALTSIDLDAIYTATPFALDPANPNLVIYDKNSCVTNTTNVVRPNTDGTSLVCESLVITDGYPFGVTRDFTATDVSYDRTFLGTGDTYYSTTCLPFTIAKDKVSGLSSLLAFTDNDLDAGTVMFDDAETLEAGTPYVVTVSTTQPFLSLTGVNVAVKAGAPADVTVEETSFCGTYVTRTDKASGSDETVYGFSGGKFVKVEDGCIFNPFRCYITVTSSTPETLPASLNLDPSGGTVGIGSMKAQKAAATVYTTDGILLGTFDDASAAAASLPAGIYIINGKKTLVK